MNKIVIKKIEISSFKYLKITKTNQIIFKISVNKSKNRTITNRNMIIKNPKIINSIPTNLILKLKISNYQINISSSHYKINSIYISNSKNNVVIVKIINKILGILIVKTSTITFHNLIYTIKITKTFYNNNNNKHSYNKTKFIK